MAGFSKIQFGDGLTVTDQTGGVIRVDGGAGAPGPAGPAGPTGPAGRGVPAGGTTGQVLAKTTGTDYDTSWQTAAGGTPPDATATVKGILQLAGDLAGSAASPQIAAGVIVDADVAAANKDGLATVASMRTLGTGAQQACAGNDVRLMPALSATPPASPVEGQLWAYSPTAGTIWMFRYNAGSASAYKWEFVGGPAWVVNDTTNVALTPANTWISFFSRTLARAGEYECQGGYRCNCWATPTYMIAIGIGIGAAGSGTLAITTTISVGGGTQYFVVINDRPTFTAGQACHLSGQSGSTSGGNNGADHKWLTIRPVRVS